MPLAKHARGRKRRRTIVTAVPIVGAAGLSLSPAIAEPVQDSPQRQAAGHEITLHEEEIADVSLATFYVFEKENAPASRPRTRFAQACGACGGCGCGGCGCWTGTYYTSPVFGDGANAPPQAKPAHKHTRAAKPIQSSKNP